MSQRAREQRRRRLYILMFWKKRIEETRHKALEDCAARMSELGLYKGLHRDIKFGILRNLFFISRREAVSNGKIKGMFDWYDWLKRNQWHLPFLF